MIAVHSLELSCFKGIHKWKMSLPADCGPGANAAIRDLIGGFRGHHMVICSQLTS